MRHTRIPAIDQVIHRALIKRALNLIINQDKDN